MYLTLLLFINVFGSFSDVRNYQIVRKVSDVVAYICVGKANSPLMSSRSSSPGSAEGDLESAAGKAAPFKCPTCAFVGDCHRTIQQHCIVVHRAKWQGEALPLQGIKLPSWTDTVDSQPKNLGALTQTSDASGCSLSTLSCLASADGSEDTHLPSSADKSGDTADQTPSNSHTSSFQNSLSKVSDTDIAATSVNGVQDVSVSRTSDKSRKR